MCELCLNTALKFDKLMAHNRDNNLPVYSSISECLMSNCQRDKDVNGYYKLECCIRECENCIDKAVPPVENTACKKVNFYQYEVTKIPYIGKMGNQ